MATVEHLAKPGFWPTQIRQSTDDLVGPSTCARCHASIASHQKTTPMARTMASASESDVLHQHPYLSTVLGAYKYEIKMSGRDPVYTVSDANASLSAALLWAFGAGQVGQSYLYLEEGRWHEARASFFGSLEALQFTPGRALAAHSLPEAMSRTVAADEVVGCFRCHGTGVTSEHSVDLTKVAAGVSCEACHGPGGSHVAAATAEMVTSGSVTGESGGLVFNPRHLSPADSVDFCGACHSTSWDVRMSGKTGKATLPFPGYRLTSSRCWGTKGDALLTCTACHDPHVPLEHNPAAYDAKCLACHAAQRRPVSSDGHPARRCPVSKSACVTCHMPKVDVPELHHLVTDHHIRIVQKNEPFPE